MSAGNDAAVQRGSSELTREQMGSSVFFFFYWSKQLILQHLNTVISAGPQTNLTLLHILLPICEDESYRVCVRKHLRDAVSPYTLH